MKIGIIDALNEKLVKGSRELSSITLTGRSGVSFALTSDGPQQTMESRASLTVWFSQRVTQDQWDDVAFRIQHRKRAAQSIVRHIYGATDSRLLDALERLWEDGLFEHPAAKIIEEILESMRTGV